MKVLKAVLDGYFPILGTYELLEGVQIARAISKPMLSFAQNLKLGLLKFFLKNLQEHCEW